MRDTCMCCHEPVHSADGLHWTHDHGGGSCGTGDGQVSYPSELPEVSHG